MSVIIPQQSGRATTVERPTSAAFANSTQLAAWRVVGTIAVAFLIMSLLDMILGWYPIDFGRPEWEFGTISATAAGLTIPTLSLYLILASSIALDKPRVTKAVGIVMILLVLFLVGIGIIWLTNVPLALKATATNQMVNFGVKKSIAKSLVLFAGHGTLYAIGAFIALRRRKTT